MNLPNLIIAGPPKTGTTSIFRYLSDHPDICPSSIKEIHFFYSTGNKIDPQALEHYKSYFKSCGSVNSILLEASPRYLIGGRPIAQLIRRYLPDVKLIFILREPVNRFFSRFISGRYKTNKLASYPDIDKLIDFLLSHPKAVPNAEKPECEEKLLEFLWEGCYAIFLKEYLKLFSKKRICILLFDEISNSPYKVVSKLCRFAEIDPSYYNNYTFHIENKTRIVKYKRIHIFAGSINHKLEYLLNTHPAIRRCIRNIYYGLINQEVAVKESIITSYATEKLHDYYSPLNQDLQLLLKTEFENVTMPPWINS